MHITLESDYAIRIVVFLAQQGKRADAKLISENTEVSLRFALKILRKLVSGGIIRSYKGTTGGYELAGRRLSQKRRSRLQGQPGFCRYFGECP